MIWVVAANSNSCHIYEYNKNKANLSFLKEISHPELRKKAMENITTEKPGSYSNGRYHESYNSPTDPKEAEVESFIKEIAKELDHGRKTNVFENLIIVALPHVNGILIKNMNKHLNSLILNNIKSDIMNLKDDEIIKFIKEHK